MPLIYKYRSLSNDDDFRRVEDVLSSKHFWFANATEVNDPFEFRCAIGLTWDFEKTSEAFALVEMYLNPRCSFADALAKSRRVLSGVSRARLLERQWELSYNMWKTVAQRAALCCFAGDPCSLLMWSHYASNHHGVAIEVEIPDQQISAGPFAEVHKVEYSDELPRIDPLDLIHLKEEGRVFENLLLRKSLCWQYEHEYRVLRFRAPNMAYVPSHAAPLPQGCTIRRVIAGCAMPRETLARLRATLLARAPHIGLAYALPSSDANYGLTLTDGSELGGADVR